MLYAASSFWLFFVIFIRQLLAHHHAQQQPSNAGWVAALSLALFSQPLLAYWLVLKLTNNKEHTSIVIITSYLCNLP
jgi:hypothetical protein